MKDHPLSAAQDVVQYIPFLPVARLLCIKVRAHLESVSTGQLSTFGCEVLLEQPICRK
jgi:hypothetical protein